MQTELELILVLMQTDGWDGDVHVMPGTDGRGCLDSCRGVTTGCIRFTGSSIGVIDVLVIDSMGSGAFLVVADDGIG